MFELVLIPTDGSEYAEAAAARGFDLAEHHGAAVHLLSVVDTGPLGSVRLPGEERDPEAAFRERAADSVDRLAAEAPDELPVTTATRSGPPAEEIVNYAAENGVDVIVMGSHGRSGLDRIAVGSVTENVIRYGDVDVFVVGRAAADGVTPGDRD